MPTEPEQPVLIEFDWVEGEGEEFAYLLATASAERQCTYCVGEIASGEVHGAWTWEVEDGKHAVLRAHRGCSAVASELNLEEWEDGQLPSLLSEYVRDTAPREKWLAKLDDFTGPLPGLKPEYDNDACRLVFSEARVSIYEAILNTSDDSALVEVGEELLAEELMGDFVRRKFYRQADSSHE